MTLANEQMAREKLDNIIKRNVASAAQVATNIMSVVPQDSVVRAKALRFEATAAGVNMTAGDREWILHPNAFNQVAEKAGMPTVYAGKLLGGEFWEQNMLVRVFNEVYDHSDSKHLVRAVPGAGSIPSARGFLSDKFRRLDSRPILEAFIKGAQLLQAVPYSGLASDVRCSFKMLVPNVHAIAQRWTDPHGDHLQHEYVALGIEFGNSDFGAGALSIRSFLLRLACINGLVAEDAMRKAHLGARLTEDIEFSEKTYLLDTKTTVSAVGDIVRGVLGDQARLKLLERTEAAMTKEVVWANLKGNLAKNLTKDELRKAGEAFEGPDVVNLPPGNTSWRASNALSWIAQQAETAERRMELEKLAGQVGLGVKEAA